MLGYHALLNTRLARQNGPIFLSTYPPARATVCRARPKEAGRWPPGEGEGEGQGEGLGLGSQSLTLTRQADGEDWR